MHTLLLIEDDAGAQQFVRAALATYQVHVVSTVAAALDFLSLNQVDLVLLDLHLGKEDGMTVAAYLRQHHTYTALVIITGQGTLQTAIRAIELGRTPHLLKPVTPDLLRETVQRHITQMQAQRQRDQGAIAQQRIRRVPLCHLRQSADRIFEPLDQDLARRELMVRRQQPLGLFDRGMSEHGEQDRRQHGVPLSAGQWMLPEHESLVGGDLDVEGRSERKHEVSNIWAAAGEIILTAHRVLERIERPGRDPGSRHFGRVKEPEVVTDLVGRDDAEELRARDGAALRAPEVFPQELCRDDDAAHSGTVKPPGPWQSPRDPEESRRRRDLKTTNEEHVDAEEVVIARPRWLRPGDQLVDAVEVGDIRQRECILTSK
ncbi:MAG: response regulator [Myxococcales bacterium]|nr:response regulator [Myxococcales bacterium]